MLRTISLSVIFFATMGLLFAAYASVPVWSGLLAKRLPVRHFGKPRTGLFTDLTLERRYTARKIGGVW